MCWRLDLNSMQKRMEVVMSNNIPEIPHDVTFFVGQEKLKISCHKIFLSILSPVFQTMFCRKHCVQETSNGFEIVNMDLTTTPEKLKKCNQNRKCAHDEIFIPDVQPMGLKNVIKYAYTGRLDVDVKDALETMQAADKYDIPELTEHCSELLLTDLKTENAVAIYHTAESLGETELKEKTWKFIELNAGAMLESEQFLEFSQEDLCDFLKLDYIPNLKSEVDLFNAITKWGIYQCEKMNCKRTTENIRTVLKHSLPLIRYPAMEPREFNEVVEPSGMLSDKDCIQMLKYFTSAGEKRNWISTGMSYSCKNRTGKSVFCSAAVITDKSNKSVVTGYDRFRINGSAHEIKLKSVGVVVSQASAPLADKIITVGLYDPSTHDWISSIKATVSNFSEICQIEIDPAVIVQPNVDYRVCVNYNNTGGITDLVNVVKYSPGELINPTTIILSHPDNQKLSLSFTPDHYIIWSLQFQY